MTTYTAFAEPTEDGSEVVVYIDDEWRPDAQADLPTFHTVVADTMLMQLGYVRLGDWSQTGDGFKATVDRLVA